MKNTIYILLFIIVACGQREVKQADVDRPDTLIISDKIIEVQTFQFNHIFKNMKDKFVKTDLRQYDCTYIESYFYDNGTKINTDGLVLVDNDLCKKLFGDYKNEFGKLCGSYLFSIDRPVHKLFPITIIQGFGVVERPLVLVLFNENGEVVNSLEVADLYGEGGECLNSVYINDSTLVQSWELSEFGYDSISDKDIWETTYVKSEVTITSKGEFIDKELSRRTIIRTE